MKYFLLFLLFPISACAEILLEFHLDGVNYEIVHTEIPDPNWPGYYQLTLEADGMIVVDRGVLWDDMREVYPDPNDWARRSMAVFNIYLADRHTEGGYDGVVAIFFRERVVLNGNQLVEIEASMWPLEPKARGVRLAPCSFK